MSAGFLLGFTRWSYPGAGSAGPVLCRGVPKTSRSRSELQWGAQHPEAAALHRLGLLAQGLGQIFNASRGPACSLQRSGWSAFWGAAAVAQRAPPTVF